MEKSNKKVIIISSTIAVIILIGLVVFLVLSQNNNGTNGIKLGDLYEKLVEKQEYSYEAKSDKNNNKVLFVKGLNKSFMQETIDGKEIKMIVKDGNTYLLEDEDKVYYIYRNNDSNLNIIEDFLSEIKDSQYEIGKEKIDNKTYEYIEIPSETKFVTISFEGCNDIKTRFYFDGDKLAYIKTISDKKEETIKTTISDNVENSLFEIPADYKSK